MTLHSDIQNDVKWKLLPEKFMLMDITISFKQYIVLVTSYLLIVCREPASISFTHNCVYF